jgi:hypothetical protein
LFALPSNPIASVVDDAVGAVGAARVDAASGIATTRGGVRRASIHSRIHSRARFDAPSRDAARRRRGRRAARGRARESSRRRARAAIGDGVDDAIGDANDDARWDRKVVGDDARDDDDGRRRRRRAVRRWWGVARRWWRRWVRRRRRRRDARGETRGVRARGGDGGRFGGGGGWLGGGGGGGFGGDDDDATRGARRAAFALAAATATGAGGAREANATTTTTRRRGDGGRRATKLGDMATSALYGFAAFYGIKIALKRLFAPFALFWGTTQLLFRMHAVKISPAMLHERLIRPYLPIEYQKSLNDFGVAAMKTKAAKNAMRDGWWDKQERRFWTCAHRLLPACDSAMGERAFVFGVILAGLA